MGLKLKIALVALLVVLAAIVGSFLLGTGSGPSEEEDRQAMVAPIPDADKDLVERSVSPVPEDGDFLEPDVQACVFAGRVFDGSTYQFLPDVDITLVATFIDSREALEEKHQVEWPSPLPKSVRGGIQVSLSDNPNDIAWSTRDWQSDRDLYYIRRGGLLGTTDQSGEFRIELSPADLQRIMYTMFTRPGYCPVLVSADEATQTRGKTAGVILQPWGQLMVKVRDYGGVPAAGYDVFCRVNEEAPRDFSGSLDQIEVDLKPDTLVGRPLVCQRWRKGPSITDALGEAVVDYLPTGIPLSVVVARGEYHRVHGALIDPVSRLGTVEFSVRSNGTIRGIVKHADDRPAQKLSVAFKTKRGASAGGVTKADGSFVLEKARTGAGTLWVGFEGLVKMNLELRDDETLDVGTIVLPALAPLEGYVVSEGPIEFEKLSVSAFRQGVFLAHARPDVEGGFAMEVTPGDLLLVVRMSGSSSEDQVFARQRAVAPARDVTIHLEPVLAALRGKLPEPTEAEQRLGSKAGFGYVQETEVRQLSIGVFDVSSATSDVPWRPRQTLICQVNNRAFECRGVLPGTHSLLIRAGRFGSCWIPKVQLEAGSTTDLGEVAIGSVTASGRVLDSEGNPIAGATVEARPWVNRHTAPKKTTTTRDGRFEFLSISPGPIELGARSGNRTTGLQTLLLRPGEHEMIDLVLRPGGRINGLVTDRGEPGVGYSLTLQNEARSTVDDRTTTSDSTGRFTFECIGGGRYTLILRPGQDGNPTLCQRPLRLEGGETVEVHLHIEDDPVEIQLLDNGDPVEDLALATVRCIDPLHPLFGESRTGFASGPGAFEVDIFPCAMLVKAWRGGANVLAVLDGTNVSRRVSVRIGRGVVEVDFGDDVWHGARPILRLVEVRAGPVERAFGGYGPRLPHRDTVDGRIVFYAIPEGALVRLEGKTPDGRDASKEFNVFGPAPIKTSWP
jgi:hypothetical protein